MPISYDTESGDFKVSPEYCTDCEEPRYDTGCDARGCDGWRCNNCGTGCDVDIDDEGRCATALAAEPDEDYDERVNAERAALGLSRKSPEFPVGEGITGMHWDNLGSGGIG